MTAMTPRRIRTGLLLLLFFFCTTAWASGAAERLEEFLSSLDTLQADFIQTVTGAEQGSARLEGTFYLRRPNQFRWEYLNPEPQSIIADGRQIWVYDPELEQVSVQNQERALRGTPAMLLVDRNSVEESFDILESTAAEGLTWFELIPKSEESQYEHIRLGLRNNQLSRLEMKDKLGQRISFQFEAVQPGVDLKDELFIFERPDNADLYTH